MLKNNRMGWETDLTRRRLSDLKNLLATSCPNSLFLNEVSEPYKELY